MHFFSNLLNQRLKTNSNVLNQFPFFANNKNVNATQNFVSCRVKQIATIFISLSDRSLHESIFKPHFRLDQIEDKNLFKIFDRRLLPVLKCFREHREKRKRKKKKKKKQICRSDVKGNRAGGAIRHVRLSNR